MHKKRLIRGFLALVMLILLVFSVTPKLLLHSLLASHKDSCFRSNSNQAELNSSGFHCDVDNLVVESPFLFEEINVSFNTPVVFANFQDRPLQNPCHTEHGASFLRGPPPIV